MRLLRHIHIRIAVLAAVGLIVLGVGAALASTRAKSTTIGTGVVVVNTNLGYQDASAAGTGMVLTSSGEVLTNNHVIAGATTIKVKIPGTSHTYTAQVLGYDVTDDVAVLQLVNASNLKTVSAGSAPSVGASVTAVGNAGGTGTLVSAKGTVTGLHKTITVSDDSGGAETLTNLIETNANLQAGDSGGPLFNSSGKVVGMDTAASEGSPFARYGSSAGDGYAIPIARALSIASKIEAGKASATIHVGGTGFLGVQVAATQSGVGVAGVVSGGPAAKAGIVAGDVITSVGGTAVSSPTQLQSLVLAKQPGAKLSVTYVDVSGFSHTTTVTLGTGPAQ
jgi:S1-C subfamily serine protease